MGALKWPLPSSWAVRGTCHRAMTLSEALVHQPAMLQAAASEA